MVTKSKLFDIFDLIKDNELSFCVLCLRNQNETKLVKPKAFMLFMESFNYKFKNPMICYMCEAKAESALKFVSMVHFAVTVEKIMQDIFSHYHKYHNTKQRLLDMLTDASKFRRTPFMADVCDCEEMVDVVRDRTVFRRTDTLTLHACVEHLDTGQQSSVCNSYNFPLQRTPDPAPFSTQRNLMDNIVLFPASTNGHGPNVLAHLPNAMLYKNILIPSAEQVAFTGPTPAGNPKDEHSNDLVVQRVIAGSDGIVYLQNEAKNRLHRPPTATKLPATQENTYDSNLYSEDCIRKMLKDKMQDDTQETTNESKRMKVGSVTSNYSRGERAASLRSGERTASLRSGEPAVSLRSGEQTASLRSGEQVACLRSGEQAASLGSGEQIASSRSGEQAARLWGGEQAASLRSGEQAASLRSAEQAPNSRISEQTSKEAVMDPRKIDWEDKIPMDLISFVEGAGQNSRNLIYQPACAKQMHTVDPPFTACITDVRSEREHEQDSDDDLIVVNNATPCIEID